MDENQMVLHAREYSTVNFPQLSNQVKRIFFAHSIFILVLGFSHVQL